MVIIDTDVFILEFAFHRDSRHAVNADSLAAVREQEPAITVCFRDKTPLIVLTPLEFLGG